MADSPSPRDRPAVPISPLAMRNVKAEARAVAEGHRAILIDADDPDPIPARRAYRIVSDTHHGKTYIVNLIPAPTNSPLNIHCRPDRHSCAAGVDDHLDAISEYPGVVPCKHAALVMRRLEREGHARFDGERWCATATFYPDVEIDLTEKEGTYDPFEGL